VGEGMIVGVGKGVTADCTVDGELLALVTVGVASTAVGAVLFANGAAVALTAGAIVRFGLAASAALASGVAAGVADVAVADVIVAGLLAKSSSVATMSKPESIARAQPYLWNIKSNQLIECASAAAERAWGQSLSICIQSSS
jgi:hypothetical protein